MKGTAASNTLSGEAPDLYQLSRLFVEAFPQLSVDDQKLSLELYRLLLEGEPVALDRLARTVGIAGETAYETLSQWPGVFYDHAHSVIAFWGLYVQPSLHRFQVNRNIVYTWCAWDTLFIPQLLNATASVASTCAATGDAIELTVSPLGVEMVQPRDVVISFLTPDIEELRNDVRANFCRFVRFFRSREAGET